MSSLRLEQCDCPLCGSSQRGDKVYEAEPYRVVQCRECGLWYLSPRLDEASIIERYREDDYFSGGSGKYEGYSDYALQERQLRATFRHLLRKLHALGMTGGSLLEVGCGYGYLLSEAKPYFDSITGTDFSAGAVEQAKAHADDVYLGGVEALVAEQQFDCVIAVEVIEHIYDPNTFIEKLYRKLKPGGWLLLATPDMGSGWRKLLGTRWPSFKFPEHVTYFDRHTLSALFERHGFDAITSVPSPHLFPLSVISEKIGLHIRGRLGDCSVWIPGVVLAMAGRRS